MAFKLERPRFTNEPYSIRNEGAVAGLGVFAEKDFNKGEFIGVAIEDEAKVKSHPQIDTRTPFCKSLNHQKKASAIQKSENNVMNVYAGRNIKKGEEITLDYDKAPAYVKVAVNTKGYKEL